MRTFLRVVLAAVGLSFLTVPTAATPADPPAVKRLDDSAAEHRRIVKYWTPERMRSAKPMDMGVYSPTQRMVPYDARPLGRPGGAGGQRPESEALPKPAE